MSFELVQSCHGRCSTIRGDLLWIESPAVHITRDGLVFSTPFTREFKICVGEQVCLFFDRKNSKLAIKKPSNDFEENNAYVISHEAKSRDRLKCHLPHYLRRYMESGLGKILPVKEEGLLWVISLEAEPQKAESIVI